MKRLRLDSLSVRPAATQPTRLPPPRSLFVAVAPDADVSVLDAIWVLATAYKLRPAWRRLPVVADSDPVRRAAILCDYAGATVPTEAEYVGPSILVQACGPADMCFDMTACLDSGTIFSSGTTRITQQQKYRHRLAARHKETELHDDVAGPLRIPRP